MDIEFVEEDEAVVKKRLKKTCELLEGSVTPLSTIAGKMKVNENLYFVGVLMELN